MALEEALRGVLARVELSHASERDPDAPPAGADETRVADGVWTKPSMHLTDVHALFRIHNGLPVPLRRLGMRIVPTQGSYLSVSCEPKNPRPIAPGATRVSSAAGRTAASASAMRCAPWCSEDRPLWPDYVLVGDLGGAGESSSPGRRPATLLFRGRPQGWQERGLAALAGAACQDKGTCPVIAQAQQQRVEAERKKTAPSRNFGTAALVAFLLAAVAAAAVKPRRSPGFAMPVVAVLVIVFAAFAVATGYYALQPGASAVWMLALLVVY